MKHYIIPVFIPHYGCRQACIFCNQRKITGRETPVGPEQVQDIIERHLQGINRPRFIEVAFYGGSFTALQVNTQQQLLAPAYKALKQGGIQAIRVSTRPDCITPEIVSLLYGYGVRTIELGVQSLDECVLDTAGRGHGVKAVAEAIAVIRSFPIQCGMQLMPGLPGEDWNSLITTVRRTADLRPDFIRIYPVIVISGTKLADFYRQGLYRPLSLEQAVRAACYMKLTLERLGIKVIRTGLQATAEMADKETVLAGPYHPAFGEMVEGRFFYLMVNQCLAQLDFAGSSVTIRHHPRDTSKIRGLANSHLAAWRKDYQLQEISLRQDGETLGEIIICSANNDYVMNKWLIRDV